MGESDELAQQVLDVLRAHPNTEFSDSGIQGLLYVTHSKAEPRGTVRAAMDELADAGLVEVVGWDGDNRLYRLPD